MKVKKLYERNYLICQNPTKRLLCVLYSGRLTTGPIERNPLTETVFLGKEAIMALIHAYERTGHPNTLQPLVDRLMPILPKKPIFFSPDHADFLTVDVVRQIVVRDPQYGIASPTGVGMPSIELIRYPKRDIATQTTCLMTH
jgi:hypothetical protein